MDIDVDDGARGMMDLWRKAHDLVRLALFVEYKRTPIRREDITKKVLGSNGRLFKNVFDKAQSILQRTFGMELVELQSRAGLEQEANAENNEDPLTEARKAAGIKKRTAAAGSKTYILRSVLDPIIIEHAALTDELILEEEALDAPSDDEDDEGFGHRSYGSIISWSTADQLGTLGILYVLLSLILVNGRVMSDMELRSILKRLHLNSTSTVPLSSQSTHQHLTTEQLLANLIRQGYLDRVQIGEAAKGKGKGAKRGRATQADEEAGTTYEWRWGNRAQSEIGEKAIAKFIAEFMVGREDEDEDEEGDNRGPQRRRADAETRLEKMTQGIGRAAGGQLADLK
ncbi:MAGE family-domain-containing protein [Infundibulicybe gibba]|nr:MAGE family-domain-containing protein [Infundibulicybe gibba]